MVSTTQYPQLLRTRIDRRIHISSLLTRESAILEWIETVWGWIEVGCAQRIVNNEESGSWGAEDKPEGRTGDVENTRGVSSA
jgi:hypothetical protein